MIMRSLQFSCIVAAMAFAYPFSEREPAALHLEKMDRLDSAQTKSDEQITPAAAVPQTLAKLETDRPAADDHPAAAEDRPGGAEDHPAPAEDHPAGTEDHRADAVPPKLDLSYLAYYAYSEVPPDVKPADTVLSALKDIPVGTPVEEIKRVSDAFGLDFSFMKTVAKIESDFDPKQRTGSYIGLFQLSNYEFDRYGSGDITNPRDNAVAAAYKFTTAAIFFELSTHKKATLSDLYLIHQQGTQGAAEHVSHPERLAWQSMCATDEGKQKGEKWCKRAIWQNTLPDVKHVWKSVDNLTSGAFVNMWQQRVAELYARYSEAVSAK
ncbi:MAG: transglycosylase [Xanthobacteraceae bacterium]